MIIIPLVLSLAAHPVAAMRFVAPECWGAEDRSRSFSGSMTKNDGTIVEQIGRRGSERVVQKLFGDLRVCMITYGFGGEHDDPPSRWSVRSERVMLETRMPNDVRTLDVDNGRLTYTVNGAVRPLDADVQEWRDNLLDLLDASWDLVQLRGRESSLRGEISSILGERSSLQGRISSYRGQVSSMKGEISSLRAAMSERRIDRADGEARVADVERRIRAFDVEGKIAPIQRRLDELEAANRDRVIGIEAEIRSLEVVSKPSLDRVRGKSSSLQRGGDAHRADG
jgi:SMC interacting uncharacterized protein involved in chromosome segregation